MFQLIYGGSGSGKSAYAEQQLISCGEGRRIYIATMRPDGEEGRQRVKRHQLLRAGKGFETIECYHSLDKLDLTPDSMVLLESLSNLIANELFDPEGAGIHTLEAVIAGIDKLRINVRQLIVVTDNLFSDAAGYDAETENYRAVLGEINRYLAAKADLVTEVVVGIPRNLSPFGDRSCIN